MKLSSFRRLTRSDHPDAPEWMERVFDSLNEQIENLTTALQAGLTLGDNFLLETKKLALAQDVETQITLLTVKNPVLVLVGDRDHLDYPELAWKKAGTSRVKLKVKYPTPPGRKVNTTLFFFGS